MKQQSKAGKSNGNAAKEFSDVVASGKYLFEPPRKSRTFRYKPQEDITAYEVALMVEFIGTALSQGDLEQAYERLPDAARRHLEIVE